VSPFPYIGVTGIVTDANAALMYQLTGRVRSGVDHDQANDLVPSGYRLMAGVLVSSKTLDGTPLPNRRYPTRREASQRLYDLADEDAHVWPVAHYNLGGDGRPLAQQLDDLVEALDPAGVQLNVVRPSLNELLTFRGLNPRTEIILQVNGRSLRDTSPHAVWAYVSTYTGLATHALVDLSGGTGRTIDLAWAGTVLGGWQTDWPAPGIAGGLGPDGYVTALG
jgi:hypothetical protein